MNNVKFKGKKIGRKRLRQIVAVVLMGVVLISNSIPVSPCAAEHVNKEDLITNVTNPSNGKIRFNINVPAGVTVEYKVQLVPHVRTGSIDTVSGSYKNTSSNQVTRTITVDVDYYTSKYEITATYYTGPARNRTYYEDTDSATSGLKTTVFSNKFVWDDAAINRWKLGQRVGIVLTFAVTGAVDIAVSKGAISGAYATVLSISLLGADLENVGVADVRTVTSTPIKGWGYQYKLSPCAGGYTKYLLVYDEQGRLHQTYNLGTISLSGITLAIR